MAVSDTHAAIDASAAQLPGALAAADYLPILPVVICFLAGAVMLILRKRTAWHGWIAIPALSLLTLTDLLLLRRVAGEGPQTMMMGGWRAPFGIAFTADLAGTLFATVGAMVALACGLFALVSISAEERRYGFFPFLFLMMGGVSGAFLTGDIFNLYVWFEVLLIGSFGLLILGSRHQQLDGAIKYCFLNLVGTTLFLIATGYLYGWFGTLNMADIARKAADQPAGGGLYTIAALYLVAFGMKAAGFPLNAWLPASYHTPRFVVSALFAGLLTKVGVYALIRVLLMLLAPQQQDLAFILAWVAGLTMMVGALGALAQTDLRRLLNYVVISGIGTIFVGIAAPGALGAGGDGAVGLSGALFYALHSIVVMTGLYLAAGVATDRAGSSSLHDMGGLWRGHVGFAAMMLVLLFAVSGLPPFSGFWPKLMLVRASFAAGMPWLGAAVLASGFLVTIASARVFALAFWRSKPEHEATAVEPARYEHLDGPKPRGADAMLPILGLVCLVLAAGLWPQWLAGLTRTAAAGILDPGAYLHSVFGAAP
ncbi:Na+/H+ antiporter subunit D [Aurantimonas sp. MSK8Z-1]|uniref:Na+/H+ antiporter subunit D n=1 Tax=Mangrovibrevibacter kandeliae TaxID=2968473 RepID=UPI002117BBD4|nr:Na+/H+ antiporter subunit D [Aurantimonas sp. MSK8Z-1]MCW4113653.1 Na+/H+ antiporter subunit D [Aurantimonas sp. MSK8Z-1]